MNRHITLIILSLLAASCTGGSFLVETESFTDKGGWVSDFQAFEKIHSCYLLAHGNGTPVEDATTTVSVPSPGTYHVYASTYNWTSPWYDGEGPGAFQIAVDGNTLPEVLGTKGDKWGWQYAGCVELSGKATLSLKDLKGFEGRVDAIYFSKKQQAPDADYLSLDKKRMKWTGVKGSNNIAKADLVVVGGGVSGCSTALTAARYGLDVVLIDNQPWMGGNAQLLPSIGGVGFKNLYPKIGRLTCEMVGLVPDQKDTAFKIRGDQRMSGGLQNTDVSFSDDLRRPVNDSRRSSDILDAEKKVRESGEEISDPRELEALEGEYIRKNVAARREKILKEAGIRIYQNIQIYKVRKDGSKIVGITGKDLNTGEEYRFSGDLFADCTGDGVIGYLAGAEFSIGRESKDFANEPSAPEVADKKTSGASLYWYSFPRANPGTFPKLEDLPWAMQVDSTYHLKVHEGTWWWETGLEIDNALEAELIRDNLLRAIYGNWAYLKEHDPEFADSRLDYVQRIAMKRESRRIKGDVMLTESDIMSRKEYEDASFTTTWTIDTHFAKADNAAKFPGWEWVTDCTGGIVDKYHVPYRCLYSKDIDNLFIGGRCMSVSHMALGTVRVQFTLGMAGEVTGMAAKICKDHGSLPRSVYTDYLDELKDCMKTGIPGTE